MGSPRIPSPPLLLLLLLLATLLSTSHGVIVHGLDTRCQCADFYRKPLRLKSIRGLVDHRFTSSCHRDVIASLPNGRKVCLDPDKAWVKHILRRFKKEFGLNRSG
ncbi:interleukin-8-like [Petromyzon marinus]|uniref:interleukin-8-like n=1 Tax=Petromyzon marinus TaxID=7757 RepID=UPI003F702E85